MRDINGYMYDDHSGSGTNLAEFIQECRQLDANTVIKDVDFAKANILSYDRMSPNKSPLFYGFVPGKTKVGNPLKYVDISGFYDKLNKQGVARLLNENINEDHGTRTIFQFVDESSKKISYYFPGSIAMAKTASSVLPFYYSDFSHERNLLMAHELGNTDSHKIKTVLRKCGNFYKIVRFYNSQSHSYEHHDFMEIPDTVNRTGAGRCISWTAKQGRVELLYEFLDDTKAVKDKFSGTKYVPCYRFRLCDVGSISSGISVLWRKTDDTLCRSPLEVEEIRFNQSNGHTFASLMEKARKVMWTSAPNICTTHEDCIVEFDDKAKFLATVNSYCVANEMDKKVGKKLRKAFLENLSDFADSQNGIIRVTATDVLNEMDTIIRRVSADTEYAKKRSIGEFNASFRSAVIKNLRSKSDNNSHIVYPPKEDDVTEKILSRSADEDKKACKNLA